jgi:hypothetical protein
LFCRKPAFCLATAESKTALATLPTRPLLLVVVLKLDLCGDTGEIDVGAAATATDVVGA